MPFFQEHKGATFSPDRLYRYALWRIWHMAGSRIAFIGLNPSTADEEENDPTVQRCINHAKRLGYGGMYMLNLFAWRDTDPAGMMTRDYPVEHPHPSYKGANDNSILSRCKKAGKVVLCWGNLGKHIKRDEEVLNLLNEVDYKLFCFGITNLGCPKHPLYLPRDTNLIQWEPK